MSTAYRYLRDVVAAGFCGTASSDEKNPVLRNGRFHRLLDAMIENKELEGVHSNPDSGMIAMTRLGFSYEEALRFQPILFSMAAQWKKFFDLQCEEHEPLFEDHRIKFPLFQDAKSKAFVEVQYAFYPASEFVPIYTLAALYLLGRKEEVRIRTISALSSFEVEKAYLVTDQLGDLLRQGTSIGRYGPGPQCAKCSKAGCPMATDFEKMVFGWLKAKQDLKENEEIIRKFLLDHGPQPAGANTFFLKHHKRHTLRRGTFDAAYNEILTRCGKALPYLKIDGAALVRGAKEGHVPQDLIGKYFKFTGYNTIESVVNPYPESS